MLNTIIVGLDCSKNSNLVLDALKTLQIHAQTMIIFSHILPSSTIDNNIPLDRPHQTQEVAYRNLENLLYDYRHDYPHYQIEVVAGDPPDEIIRLANLYCADLIVIGSRGLRGFKRVIEGSVSSQVVADAPCSVFVVKC